MAYLWDKGAILSHANFVSVSSLLSIENSLLPPNTQLPLLSNLQFNLQLAQFILKPILDFSIINIRRLSRFNRFIKIGHQFISPIITQFIQILVQSRITSLKTLIPYSLPIFLQDI